MPYLNDAGLARLWAGIKARFAPISHLHAGDVHEKIRATINVPTAGWTTNAQGWAEKTVSVAGLTTQDDVDMAVQGAQIGSVLLAGGRCDAAGQLTLVCLAAPSAAFDLLVRVKGVRA